MSFRVIACCAAALVMSLPLGPGASAAPACDRAGCRTTADGKPLDIMQFMREQAASTRVAKPRRAKARAAAPVQRSAHRSVAARPKPKPATLPVEASKSFASQPEQDVPVVASDEVNAIDRAADRPADKSPPETVGAAAVDGPVVQLVDASEFNDIDRKAENGPPLPANPTHSGDASTHNEQASASWLQRIWSALGSTLTALASAVHHLIG